jgi:hypothetical protein
MTEEQLSKSNAVFRSITAIENNLKLIEESNQLDLNYVNCSMKVGYDLHLYIPDKLTKGFIESIKQQYEAELAIMKETFNEL